MKKTGLSFKLCSLIFLSMLVLSGFLTSISYLEHGNRVDAYYRKDASALALALSHQADGDFILKLRKLVDEPEFQEIRKKAEETEDYTPIKDYLDKKGLLEEYDKLVATYEQMVADMDVKYVYIESIEGPISIYQVSAPGWSYAALGVVEENPEEFSQYTTNVHIDPAVSKVGDDWLCSAYEPIYDSTGKAVSTVGVDIDMNQVVADRTAFGARLLSFSLLITMLAIIAGIILIRKMAVNPILDLMKGTKAFTDAETGYARESVISLKLHSRDEIMELYQEIRLMQTKILDYIDNITKITAEKERIGAELNVATQIQASMLPRIFPAFPEREEFDLFASMDPAKEVGGDFYDFFLIDEQHLAMVIADVSGKGVPAALFMAIAKTLIKDRARESLDPADILSNANDRLSEENDEGLFVTVWLGILDLTTGQLNFSDAGHEYPVMIHENGETELVKAVKKRPPVATMEGIPYNTTSVTMKPGDTIFLYTDGVPEATNAQNELYGMERLEKALQNIHDLSPAELLPSVRKDVDSFVGEAPQFDDLTMLALRLKCLVKISDQD